MDPVLITIGAWAFLKPFLEKAGEKAAETIGEKFAEKTTEKSFWKKVKGLFILEEEKRLIQEIENKPVVTQQESMLIENKLSEAIRSNPQFASEMQAHFNLSPVNIFIAEQLLKSMQADKDKLTLLFHDSRLAGIETEDQYDLMVKKTVRRLEKSEKEFLSLINPK